MSNVEIDDPLLTAFRAGEIIAYPTEAVYGLGCDPDNHAAVLKLLNLKQRSVEKGLILIGRTYSQLLPYVNDAAIPMDMRTEIFSSWPGPNTWLLPKSNKTPYWLTGGSELIAVRVSAHVVVQGLCSRFDKPIVSTSANRAGESAARTRDAVIQQFSDKVILIDGELTGAAKPSRIRNGLTGQIVREN
jgi:L-threonylcarbamoyladenylate synthase